jgi:hypothetical protein
MHASADDWGAAQQHAAANGGGAAGAPLNGMPLDAAHQPSFGGYVGAAGGLQHSLASPASSMMCASGLRPGALGPRISVTLDARDEESDSDHARNGGK